MTFFTDFHLLRPWALITLLPLALIALALWFSHKRSSGWSSLIAPELLAPLADKTAARRSRAGVVALFTCWILTVLALAGPTWERAPSQVHRQTDAMVIVLDLSPSMISDDVKPSRMVRARLKIAELLKRRDEGDTALVVYGDDAHVVTPLTADTDTINALLPVLSPGVMPVPGSRTEAGIERAITMLSDAGFANGRILLVTDGVTDNAVTRVRKLLDSSPYRLSILGIGSDQPVPIRSGSGGFLRDAQQNVITTELGSATLQQLAQGSGGRYITSTFDTRDIDHLMRPVSRLGSEHTLADNRMDVWVDRGPWLAILLLPALLYAFRRGVLLALVLVPMVGFMPPPVQAQSLPSWLLTPDQRGARAMEQNRPTEAAELFEDPAWRATAAYRAGDYQTAAEQFAKLDTADAHYNRGNALAHTGNLDDAIAAYDRALELDPQMADAAANKAQLEQLKEQQQNNQQHSQDQQDQQGEKNQQQQQDQQDQQSSPSSEEELQDQQQSSSADGQSGQQQTAPQNPEPQQGQGQSSSQSSSAGGDQDQREPEPQENAETSASSASSQGETDEQAQAQAQPLSAEEQEKQQAQEQWLRQIPDDPSGLLRNKFQYEYQLKRQERMNSRLQQLDDIGNSEQRW
ncbi:VWA domain-containing protein [Gilvimarinus algae]|uniref:VWA domain-containing protein n=1 Tax=Gilvimarinus algae TaxID=3058037 RepID=A0ABT8TDN1_9GAMM|nr:VWA domain-containing protein [Gilvimarinus sp. SDUM040014]MDO3382202.1 VWA domain-containing protein [Gilvimarinus sp. SDUM040014]